MGHFWQVICSWKFINLHKKYKSKSIHALLMQETTWKQMNASLLYLMVTKIQFRYDLGSNNINQVLWFELFHIRISIATITRGRCILQDVSCNDWNKIISYSNY